MSDLENFVPTANIKVIGVGGGGNNSVETMIQAGIQGVEFIVANTDIQALQRSSAPNFIHLGENKRGLGAGANPEVGKKAAEESIVEIKEKLKGADMVIITSGMGGGTGTGASPIIAKIARELGALTISIVTTPFEFEGNLRNKNAQEGIKNLRAVSDSIITISNNKLLEQYGDAPMKDSFLFADTILKHTVKTITDIIAIPAHINLDFADVKTVMKDKGDALIGIGRASGKDRAVKAAIHAISSPIIETSIQGASHTIINITGSANLTLTEVHSAVNVIKNAVGPEMNTIFGATINESIGDEIYVSVIATGLSSSKKFNSEQEIKDEVSSMLKTMEIDLQASETKTILINDPLPKDEKMVLTSLLDRDSKILEKDDSQDDTLPFFLKRNV